MTILKIRNGDLFQHAVKNDNNMGYANRPNNITLTGM